MQKRFILSVLIFLSAARVCYGLRIVSLLPSNTEIADAIGASDDLVGVSAYDTPGPHRQSVGDLVTPNLEVIVSLKPDVILAGAWKSSRVVSRLREMGYRVVEVANPHSIEEIYQDIRSVAQVINREERAEKVIAEMRRRLNAAQRTGAAHAPVPLFIEIDRGYWTPGGSDFLTEAVRIAGGENIFADIRKEAGTVSPESLMERQPSAILCLGTSAAEFSARPAVQLLTAVRRKRVFGMAADLLTRPSPKLVDGIERLAAQLSDLSRGAL